MNKVLKKVIAILIIVICIPINIGAQEESYIGKTSRSIKSIGDNDNFVVPYITINNNQGYCYDMYLEAPKNIEYKKEILEDQKVMNMIYAGYPFNGMGLKEKYNISEDDELTFTQVAIWYYREGLDRSELTSKYVLELLDIWDRDIIPKKSFAIDEDLLVFNARGKYLETNMINTYGYKGTFTINTNGNIKVMDVNNNERYEFNVGEKFKLIKDADGITTGNFSIKANVDKISIEYYVPIDDETYQDIIVPILSNETIEKTYNVAYPGRKTDEVIQTGDKGIFHLIG